MGIKRIKRNLLLRNERKSGSENTERRMVRMVRRNENERRKKEMMAKRNINESQRKKVEKRKRNPAIKTKKKGEKGAESERSDPSRKKQKKLKMSSLTLVKKEQNLLLSFKRNMRLEKYS